MKKLTALFAVLGLLGLQSRLHKRGQSKAPSPQKRMEWGLPGANVMVKGNHNRYCYRFGW